MKAHHYAHKVPILSKWVWNNWWGTRNKKKTNLPSLPNTFWNNLVISTYFGLCWRDLTSSKSFIW